MQKRFTSFALDSDLAKKVRDSAPQNLFFEKPIPELFANLEECRDISKGMEIATNNHSGVTIGGGRNVENLITAYDIKNVLLMCRFCKNLLIDATREMAKQQVLPEKKPKVARFLQARDKEIENRIGCSLYGISSVIEQYQKSYPPSNLTFFTRIAAMTGMLWAGYNLAKSGYSIPDHLNKYVVLSVSSIVVPLGLSDLIVLGCRKAKRAICSRKEPQEMPYHLLAGDRLKELVGRNKADTMPSP